MEFVHSQSMQLILFVVSTAATVVINYLSLNLALMLNGATVRAGKKALFTAILSAAQQALTYGLYFSGLLHSWLPDNAAYIISVPSPFLAILFYVLLVRVTGMSRYRCLHTANEIYIYGVAVHMLAQFMGDVFFAQNGGPYNYLTDMLRVFIALSVSLAFYFVIRHLLQKYRFVMRLNDNVMMPHFGKRLALSVLLYFAVFLSAVAVPISTDEPAVDVLDMLFLFVGAALYVSILMNSASAAELRNKDVYIRSLTEVNGEFRALKHDFVNILHGYGGFIELGKLDRLWRYHESVTKETLGSGGRLTLASRLEEDPLLISLYIDKLNYAEKMGVDLRISLTSRLVRRCFSDLDAVRFMSILLDNAIEAAAESDEKRASLLYYTKQDGHALFVYSNSTKDDVDLDLLLQPGVTTKEGHMGQGLPTARKIIGKYQNCSMNYSSYGHEVTVYVEIGYPYESKKPGEPGAPGRYGESGNTRDLGNTGVRGDTGRLAGRPPQV